MKVFLFTLLFICSLQLGLKAQAIFPELLSSAPQQQFQFLGKVSASGSNIEKAKRELLKQAKKLEANAVILKECENSSITRDGLTWTKADAFCEGDAIQFK